MPVSVGRHRIGNGCPVYMIAEMSGNHGGKLDQAKKIIFAAKSAGANAIKLQTYTADTITLDCDREDFLIDSQGPWAEEKTLHSLYTKAFTPWEWHEELFELAENIGIDIFSSPFDLTAVDFLEDLGAIAYKLASPEITDIPLIQKIGGTRKPVFISTGLAEIHDIELAVSTLKKVGCKDIILLKCTSAYPAPVDEVNLHTIPEMEARFKCPVGLSDHTLGCLVPIAAAAVGAKAIEKHIILDNQKNTVDSFFSATKSQFEKMVKDIRLVEKALGKVSYHVSASAKDSMNRRRSLYVSQDIQKGERLTPKNIKSVRPGFGLHPMYYEEVLGKKVNQNLVKGDRLSFEVIDDDC